MISLDTIGTKKIIRTKSIEVELECSFKTSIIGLHSYGCSVLYLILRIPLYNSKEKLKVEKNYLKEKTKQETEIGTGDLWEILMPRKPWAYDWITHKNDWNYASKILQELALHYNDITKDLHDGDTVYDVTYI